MRLRTVSQNIPLLVTNPRLLDTLESCGIKTTYDIIFTALPDLLSRLASVEGVMTADIITLQDQVTEATAARGVRGDELILEETATFESAVRNRHSRGIQIINDLLGIPLSGPYVIELSGTTGSGKSTLAIQIIASWLAQDIDASALWMDCSGDFTAERARGMCLRLGLENDAASKVLERIQIVLSFEFETFQATLDDLEASLLETPKASLRWLVIDPITPLLSSQLTGNSRQGHATMSNVMQQLAWIAQTYNITVFVINRTATSQQQNTLSSFPGTVAKPALGPSFTFLSHATIWLSTADAAFGKAKSTTNKPTRRAHIAEVFRSRVSPSRSWCAFDILDGMIVPSANHPHQG